MAKRNKRAVALMDELLASLREYERRSDPERRPGLRNAIRELKGIRHEVHARGRRRGSAPGDVLRRAMMIVMDTLLED